MTGERHEFVTPLREMTSQLHEMFVALTAAGFSKGQACQILGAFLANMATNVDGEGTQS